MASPAIDLSGGFVPKSGPSVSPAGIDLSGGFVPKAAPTPASFSIPSPGLGPKQVIAPQQAPPPTPAPAPSDDPAIAPQPSVAERYAHSAATQSGIPTSMDELKSAQPSLAEEIGGPAATAGKIALNYGKNLVHQGADAAHEVGDAYQNIKEGQPVGENIGKMGAAASDFALKGVLSPVGGPAVAKAGEDLTDVGDTGTSNWLPDITKLPEALGDVTAAVPQVMTSLSPLTAERAALPATTKTIAGAEIPLKTSQFLEDAGHPGMARAAAAVEPISQSLPGGGALQKVTDRQQAGIRQGLANVAAKSGAEVSADPANIEKNFTDAAAATKEAAQGKYQHLSETSKGGDFSEPQATAQSILDDPDTSKLLSKPVREALQNAAGGTAAVDPTVDSVARQYYKKSYASLSPEQKVGLHKILPDDLIPKKADVGMDQFIKARSGLADAAYSKAGEPEGRTLSMQLKSLDDSIDSSLQKHDAANGTDLAQTRRDANDLWTKMFATQKLRDGLQGIMTGQPQLGKRVISGGGLQEVVNKLDPAGGKEYTTPLQKMTNGDPQTLKDIHELADWAGKNQATARAGMGGMMAKLRLLSLPAGIVGLGASPAGTVGLFASSAILAQLLARPGIAKAMLGALRIGSDATKSAAAFGQFVHAVSSSKPDQADSADPESAKSNTPNTTTNAPSPNPNPGVQPTTTSAIEPASASNKNTPSTKSLAQTKDALTMTPSSSLWKGKESKVLTLRGPDGKQHDWQLRNGTPAQVD